MSWMAIICPECGSEVTCELKGWRVVDKCTNPDCPTNKRVSSINTREKSKKIDSLKITEEQEQRESLAEGGIE